ncbi:MAG: sugar transferase [Oscillospiraceae bacterium]|nr:sugar transferase [Oscillospiraceae bacterium]
MRTVVKNDKGQIKPQEFMRESPAAIVVVPYKKRGAFNAFKRSLDVIFSLLGLLILSPVFLVTAIAIKLDSRGSVFFSQIRVGKKGKLFKMFKFRSMCSDAEEKQAEFLHMNENSGPTFKITNDPRVTKVGKVIRRLCVDELPQLLNVLRGEMSIVGPRPPLPCEVDKYTAFHFKRLDITPGLTCYWQVSGNKNITFDEWVQMDINYINNRNIIEDIKIILMTFQLIITGKGADCKCSKKNKKEIKAG